MATIQDTLNEIEQIQEEFKLIEIESSLVDDLMGFSTSIYFDYISHAVLDQARTVDLSSISYSKKYYELFAQKELLQTHVRFNNIGQLFVIWNAYEKYLRQKYIDVCGSTEFKVSILFEDLTLKLDIEKREQTLEEFEVIRNTRNSLFNPKFKPFQGSFCGTTFYFIPGELVKPLRIMNVIRTMWEHFKRLEKINVA
ncbi:hypothetical protein [Algibacter mikhailovii]|uniref:Uncharacterized protein n=1 Tax=Algibacter mikhailovii TaxID=425498 RepID=A0A918V466_9FLAO|nr:hypothetical protein [Algibacter mikhailovii]GGZ67228.1 hypothetical protein GCM10007028_00070 [Algibacter mikhailovii]